jgi:quercetin 2,3-dioxygenase
MAIRRIDRVLRGEGWHWVGNGFPVTTLMSYRTLGEQISPFLLLDYAAPRNFPPSETPRGVDWHPHRGFETVTIVYQGELEHRDTAGHAGNIGPGDVQWMTAARGVLHEEKHSAAFSEVGGPFEVAQLWVNLPADKKMSEPRYQEIAARDIPTVELPNAAGRVRVIAGEYGAAIGPAKTFTPIDLLDLRLNGGGETSISPRPRFNVVMLVMHGKALASGESVGASELAIFERSNGQIILRAETDAAILLMAGEPIEEPIVGAGPFVMNTEAELSQAFADFRAGKF